MANPRKFSEKIALHNQKQAEETAAFEQIMREVSDATAKPEENNQLAQMGIKTTASTHIVRDGVKSNIQQRESRGRSVGGGPIRSRPIERKMDTSPYSSGPYLSPPPDTSWRRTNSDSALHHTTMQLVGECSNLQRRQADSVGSRWNMTQRAGTVSPSSPQEINHRSHHHHHHSPHHHNHEQRPRSSCDVPRVPGINIYPSAHEPGIIQIPIGNNTGSLPDLTNVHFPTPLNNPLDNEQDQSSSPYSSSPVSASPATLSPTSLPTRQPSARFQFSPGSGARANSPVTSTHQNHLSVPVGNLNSRFLHHSKGVTLDNSLTNLIDTSDYQQTQYQVVNNITNMYSQQQCSPPSPTAITRQPAQMGPNTGYRSPQTRPSPQSSPGIAPDGIRNSAPCSPSAPHSPLPSDNYLYNQSLLQHFEACSMMDNPVTSNYNIETSNSSSQFTQANSDLNSIVTSELGNDAGYFSTSPSALTYPTAPTSLHTTPNTPTSIPDIILTDFSNAADEYSRQELSKELGNAITGTLDADFFPSDESLREGLAPLDIDGLQMLTDPDLQIISDYTEDHFRQDRL